MTPPLRQAYGLLLARFGPQHWWPAQTRLEMMLGAILTQNTSWTNVAKAIAHLRRNHALQFDALERATQEQIAEWIRPAGYFNQKSGYIKNMVGTIRERFGGSLNTLFALDTPALRKELLSWKGVGPETADSILLYAAKRPAFVVDAYTKRVGSRHGWIGEKATYDEVARLFTDHLPGDVALFNEYHALIVRLCKEHCNTQPKCAGCPLEPLLPKPPR
ncbi:endonuclease III domain-containing protein [Pontiella sp.]|uniref:endonuclease III domain-containing protein n=1 Tax=Pontiella sp. TaxID=2837462 RepID=UPI00356A8047